LSRPDLVDGRDRAAAGADLDHVDHRRLDRQAGALGEAVHARGLQHRRDLGAAVLDQAGLGGGAAHVEGDHIGLPAELAEQRGRLPPPAGPDSSRRIGKARWPSRRAQAAGGMHQAQVARKPRAAVRAAASR
jgi:hypothetical protein